MIFFVRGGHYAQFNFLQSTCWVEKNRKNIR